MFSLNQVFTAASGISGIYTISKMIQKNEVGASHGITLLLLCITLREMTLVDNNAMFKTMMLGYIGAAAVNYMTYPR